MLDGGVSRDLRERVGLSKRRRIGAFPTPHELADELVLDLPLNSRVFDPSAGTGDLLLARARQLPLLETVAETQTRWEMLLKGNELYREFAVTARRRLALQMLWRHGQGHVGPRRPFDSVRTGDALELSKEYAAADVILLNPPFGHAKPRRAPEWSQGSISKAAIHIAHAVSNARAGTEIRAILPDVLRTGTRYNRWREWVAQHARIESVVPRGRFDEFADVNVFTLFMRVGGKGSLAQWFPPAEQQTVGSSFEVSVGSVVPHRNPLSGPLVRFAHAKALPRWQVIRALKESRRFSGRLHQPPFVAIRRTSSPADNRRAVASVIVGKRPVAVENHLIVATPRHGGVAACKRLMDYLDSDVVDRWLNERISCRHLTVSSISSLPYEG